jgi:DNA polymerase IV
MYLQTQTTNKPRIIMHIDMNSYFASVEQQANPFLRGKPIGVTGKAKAAASGKATRSIISAASIEAKRMGIKGIMSTWQAKRACPSLIFVQGDMTKYNNITKRFNEIFSCYTDQVEVFSVDESFLDITSSAKDYLGAIAIAQMIKHDLKRNCGKRITCSIGIGSNKLMAKLASEQIKPDGLTIVRPGEEETFLDTCALQDLCGIGPRIYKRLFTMGITNFQELRKTPLTLLQTEFKSYGNWLYAAARGNGDNQVISELADPKSMGHSYTLPEDTYDEATLRRTLLGLADKVAWRLRRDGFSTKLVRAYVRYGDFDGNGQEIRFKEPIKDGLDLYKVAWKMINTRRNKDKPIRLLGITASGLTKNLEQPPLFKKEQKFSSVLSALDTVQRRYGQHSWTRASLLGVNFHQVSHGFQER